MIRADRTLTASIARSLLVLRRRSFRSRACVSKKKKITAPQAKKARSAAVNYSKIWWRRHNTNKLIGLCPSLCVKYSPSGEEPPTPTAAPICPFHSKVASQPNLQAQNLVLYISTSYFLPPHGLDHAFHFLPVHARLASYAVPVQGRVVVARRSRPPCPCRVWEH